MIKLEKLTEKKNSEERLRIVKKSGNLKFILHSFTIALFLIRVFFSSIFFSSSLFSSTLENAFYSMCFVYQISFTIHVFEMAPTKCQNKEEKKNNQEKTKIVK